MRASLAMAFLAAALTACGSSGETGGDPAATRVERCVDRLLERTATDGTSEEDLRRYARDTYCARFEEQGWVYDDGALRIAAQHWLEQGATCATETAGEPPETGPCEQVGSPLDCALLRHVRRSEVAAYLEQLQRAGPVECDDGTPLDDLGVP